MMPAGFYGGVSGRGLMGVIADAVLAGAESKRDSDTPRVGRSGNRP